MATFMETVSFGYRHLWQISVYTPLYNDNNADGFQTWRINTAHSLLKMKRWSLTMNAGVDNVFDYVDRTPFGRNRATSTPGRTFMSPPSLNSKQLITNNL